MFFINEPSQIKNDIHRIERNSAKHLARCSLVAGIGHSYNNNQKIYIPIIKNKKKRCRYDCMIQFYLNAIAIE